MAVKQEFATSHDETMNAQSDTIQTPYDRSHDPSLQAEPLAMKGFAADQNSLPAGYFYGPFFLGTVTATGLGLTAAVGGFGLAAPNLTLINAEIGPSGSISWVSLVYTLTMAIGLLLVGRLSDLFGRRV